jgi:hypothetical protein
MQYPMKGKKLEAHARRAALFGVFHSRQAELPHIRLSAKLSSVSWAPAPPCTYAGQVDCADVNAGDQPRPHTPASSAVTRPAESETTRKGFTRPRRSGGERGHDEPERPDATSSLEESDREREGPSPRITDMGENVRHRVHRPRCRDLPDRLESSRANPVFRVPVVVEARDAHPLASLPGMDETATADVNPAMTKVIEEHQIARLKAVAGDR